MVKDKDIKLAVLSKSSESNIYANSAKLFGNPLNYADWVFWTVYFHTSYDQF